MGDGSAVVPDKHGRMDSVDIDKVGKAVFARPMHPDFEKADAVYVRRMRKVKGTMSGDDIRAVQKALLALGLYSGKPDGRFAAKTKRAVEKFQKENGLEADGTVGYKVWKMLTGR